MHLRSVTTEISSWFLFQSELFCMWSGTVWLWEPGFSLKPSISECGSGPCIHGLGPPGSKCHFCLRRHIYHICSLGPLGSGSLFWSYMWSRTVLLGEPVLYLPKVVIEPHRSFWIWHMLVSGSFGFGFRVGIYGIKIFKDANIYRSSRALKFSPVLLFLYATLFRSWKLFMNLGRLLPTSRLWYKQPGLPPTKRHITWPFWMN